jgi:hypothetical protein
MAINRIRYTLKELKMESIELKVKVEVNKLYRKIDVCLESADSRIGDICVIQKADSKADSTEFNALPEITWTGWQDQSIEETRQFARGLQLAASIAADIESYLLRCSDEDEEICACGSIVDKQWKELYSSCARCGAPAV